MTPRLSAVLDELGRAGLGDPDQLGRAATAALGARELDDAPWFVRLFVAAGTCIGAALAAFFVIAVELYEAPVVAGPMSVALIAGAAFLGRHRPDRLLGQLAWALVLGGQLLLLGTVAEATRSEEALAITALLVALACVAVLPQRWLRAMSVLGVAAALVGLVEVLDMPLGHELVSVALAWATLAIWIHEPRLCASRFAVLWQPLAGALPMGMLVPHVFVMLRGMAGFEADVGVSWIASLALAGMGVWVLRVAAAEQGHGLGRGPALAAALGVVLIAVLTRGVPGVTAAVLLLITSHLRRSVWLELLGLASLGGALLAFYYQLSLGLLATSMWITASGVAVLAGAALLGRISGLAQGPRARLIDRAGQRRGLVWTSALLLVCLAIPAVLVVRKERVLATGVTVLIELAPRDPRSLMQGDYMELSYAMAAEILARGAEPGAGTAVIAVDERGVARLVRMDLGEPLGPGELRLGFRHVPGRSPAVRIGAESFFFAEGAADRYAAARYGELIVAPDGSSVLVGLRDASLQRL